MRFSKLAVIGPLDEIDSRPALMVRLADIQHRLYLAESHVRLYMATTRINKKFKRGECELIGVKDMNVGYEDGTDRVLLLWPITIRHIINEDSPLYEITEAKLRKCQFELIMTIEGIVEATGMTFQARTSFLPNEILWGYRFSPLITLNSKRNEYEVDYSLFDAIEPHSLIHRYGEKEPDEYNSPSESPTYNEFDLYTSHEATFDQINRKENRIKISMEDQDRNEKNYQSNMVTKNHTNYQRSLIKDGSTNYHNQPFIIHTTNISGFT